MDDVPQTRRLVICADDFGIGPETSRGILDLALAKKISATVLLVNAPNTEDAVRRWRRAGPDCDLGWHPTLTSDAPILPAREVASLADRDGRFLTLGRFIRQWLLGRLRAEEIAAEWRAQLGRYRDLVGADPALVNTHQHVAVFHPLGHILADLLRALPELLFVRRVRETIGLWRRVPGARLKRMFLTSLARRSNREFDRRGFPGADVLAGVANHGDVHDPAFFARWLQWSPGRVVELMVHPGYRDETLVGRDCTLADGGLERRVHEREWLAHPEFCAAVRRAGFVVVAPRQLQEHCNWESAHAG
jgi:predicted glycoside hydrolase/deacetylase ChbG (UPF0249 family)